MLHIKNLSELKKLAIDFSQKLNPGTMILLEGDLGTGKTTFVSYVVKALGSLDNVSSPSFTLVNQYKAKFTIYHLDLYRISSKTELLNLDLGNYFKKKNAIFFIEWSEKLNDLYPDSFIKVQLNYPKELSQEQIYSDQGAPRDITIIKVIADKEENIE